MNVEFPLRHIEDNLLFNRNGDVWVYFKTNLLDLSLVEKEGYDTHVFVSNDLGKDIYYIGYKLIPEYKMTSRSKVSLKSNIKSLVEGINSPVKKSLGLDKYSLLKEDVLDYFNQAKELEVHLSETINDLEIVSVGEVISVFTMLLNLEADLEQGYFDLNSVEINVYSDNILMVKNTADQDGNDLLVQNLVVRKTDNIDIVSFLLDLEIPINISIRLSEGKLSQTVQILSYNEDNMFKYIDKIYDYGEHVGLDLFTPVGEQFNLYYETFFGTNKIDDFYVKEINERNVINI